MTLSLYYPAPSNAVSALRPLVDQFSVMGQSNAEGRGDFASSPAVVAGLYISGSTITYPLADPVGGALTGSMWPAFANEWAVRAGRMSAFVEAATGSTKLIANPNTSPNWSPTGALRAAAVTAANTAWTALGADVRWQRGKHYVVWSQGEGEAESIGETGDGGIVVNEANITAALIALAEYLDANVTDFEKMLIVRTGNRNDTTLRSGYATVRAAQDAAAVARPDLIRIVYRGTAGFTFSGMRLMADSVHYNQTGLNLAGKCAAREAAKSTLTAIPSAPVLLASAVWNDTDTTAVTSRTLSHTTHANCAALYVLVAVNRLTSTSTNSGGGATFGGVAMTRLNTPSTGPAAGNTGRADVMAYRITAAEYGAPLGGVTADIVVTAQLSSNLFGVVACDIDRVPMQADGIVGIINAAAPGADYALTLAASAPALGLAVASSVATSAAALTHTPPAGWTELLDSGASNGTQSGQIWAGHATLTEGVTTATLSTSANVLAGAAFALILRTAIDGEA
jgi:hypothetical protein